MASSSRLAAFRAAKDGTDASAMTPPKPDPVDENGDEIDDETEAGSGPKDKDKHMTEAEVETMKAEARADGVKAERARFNAVLTSEHYTGREAVAHKMLGKDMSAEDILDVLADTPTAATAQAEAPTNAPDPDAAAREEMKNAIQASGNSNIDPNGGAAPKAESDLMMKAVERRNAQFAAQA